MRVNKAFISRKLDPTAFIDLIAFIFVDTTEEGELINIHKLFIYILYYMISVFEEEWRERRSEEDG